MIALCCYNQIRWSSDCALGLQKLVVSVLHSFVLCAEPDAKLPVFQVRRDQQPVPFFRRN